MIERPPFEKLDINDPRRPVKVEHTVQADVPEASRRFLNHQVDQVEFPNGNKGWHHRIVLPEGVMLAHVDSNEEIALVQNYRHPIGRDSVELPSGGAEPYEIEALSQLEGQAKEDYLIGIALREFEEEIGWRVDPKNVERLLKGPLQGSVGYADQTYHIFHGHGGTLTAQNLDDGEAGMLTFNRYGIDDAAEMVGYEIVDPASSTAVMALARQYDKPSDNLKKFVRKNRATNSDI